MVFECYGLVGSYTKRYDVRGGGKGAHSTLDSVLASQPAASGLILGIPEDLFLVEIYSLGVAEIHGQRFAYRVDSAKLNC